MKKLSVCLVLLMVSAPAFAIGTGIGIGIGGGIEMMVPGEEESESETCPALGGVIDFSLPGMPMGLRGGFEYTWKSSNETIFGMPTGGYDASFSAMIILLAAQYNLVLPGAPMSFYLGAGGEMAMTTFSVDVAGYEDESETDFGFLAYGGANYSMGNMGIFAEVGYGMIFSKDEETGAENLTHIPIRGGIKFNL
jgi:hypothetical protein